MKVRYVPFCNIPLLKQMSIAAAIFGALAIRLMFDRSKNRTIIVYNVFSPFSFPVIAAALFFGVKAVAIIADLPDEVYGFHGFRGLLKRLDLFLEKRILRCFDGVISLTVDAVNDFARGKPAVIVEGGVWDGDWEQMTSMADGSSNSKVCLYSGTLDKVNGIPVLLEAFRLLKQSDYELHIYGDGPMAGAVEAAAAIDQRIRYFGRLPAKEVRQRQARATVLLNARPPSLVISRYTFPSKLLEYMAAGRPTISTMFPSLPNDYRKHLYLLRTESASELAEVIREVCSQSCAELEEVGRSAREFARGTKNWKVQGKSVYEFISAIERGTAFGASSRVTTIR
jgi:glycosyltransferase involved in cell wall biosynthesis